jgi:hypothetical protein
MKKTMTKITRYTLGPGPHEAARIEHIEHEPGVVEIQMFGRDDRHVVGHGNSAREAAAHLAEQLRTIAHFVEAHEGICSEPPAPGTYTENQGLVVRLPANLVRTIDAYLDADWSEKRDPSKIGALNAIAYIGERVAAIRKANRSTK